MGGSGDLGGGGDHTASAHAGEDLRRPPRPVPGFSLAAAGLRVSLQLGPVLRLQRRLGHATACQDLF